MAIREEQKSLSELHRTIAGSFGLSIRKVSEAFPESRYEDAKYYSTNGDSYDYARTAGFGFGAACATGWSLCAAFKGVSGHEFEAAMLGILIVVSLGTGLYGHFKYCALKSALVEDMKECAQTTSNPLPLKHELS